jgi:hypothetical protein
MPAEEVESGEGGEGGRRIVRLRGLHAYPQMEETGFRIVEVAITGQAKERSGKISEFGCGGRTCSG